MSYLDGAILIVLAGVLWSTQGLIIRLIPDTGSWAILFWRSAGMLPVLALWIGLAAPRGSIIAEIRSVGWAGVMGGLGLVMAFSGAIYAFQATSYQRPFGLTLLGFPSHAKSESMQR